jgi:hypothetical protein
MYTTVKGLIFIKEFRRFKYHYLLIIGLAILTFVLGLLSQYFVRQIE